MAPVSSLILWSQHDDIFSRTVSKQQHVLVPQLEIPTARNLFVVQDGSVSALQVNNIRLHFANLVAIFIPFLSVAELNDSVLFAEARMLCGQVNNSHLSPYQPAAPCTQFNCVDNISTFENKELPVIARWRFSCFPRLVILEHN